MDFTNGNNTHRYDPEVYIKTTSGTILAVIKFLEALFAVLGLAGLIFVSSGVSQVVKSMSEYFSSLLNLNLPDAFSLTAGNLSRFTVLLPAAALLLIILDGIGTLLMRITHSGEGLVNFVHRVYWLWYVLQIVLLLYSVIKNLLHLTGSQGSASLFSLTGALGIAAYAFMAIIFGGLLYVCNYHHDICVVLSTVHKERRSGNPAPLGNNHLTGRSTLLAIGSGFMFLYSAVLLIYPLVTHEQLISEERLRSFSSSLAPMVILGINFVFCLTVFLKYLSLRICAGNFYKYHDSRGARSSSKIPVIIVIILCILFYFILKNKGVSNIPNQNSENTRPTTVYTPASTAVSVSGTSSAAKTGSSSISDTPAAADPTVPTSTSVPTSMSGSTDGVDPDLKAFLDSYEAYMDDYVVLVKKIAQNPADLSLLMQYNTMLEKIEEFSAAADRYAENKSDMSAADLAYYTTVMMRINNKMLSAY